MAKSWLPDASYLPMNRGWDGWVATPTISPDKNGKLHKQANGMLSFTDADGGVQMIGLWVNDVQMQFGMAGQDVQSKTRRSFFPHNFAAPVTQFSGQCPNQYEYNRLSQFIRQSQLNYTRGVNLNPHGQGLRLTVVDRTPENDIDYRQRGHHGGFDAYGYILNAPAGAERWVNAPTYTFEFTITDVQGGGFLGNVLKDDIEWRNRMRSATDLFLSNPKDFVSADDVKKAQGQGKKTKRNHHEHKGNGLPPQTVNNPFLDPIIRPIAFEGPQGIVPLLEPNANVTEG